MNYQFAELPTLYPFDYAPGGMCAEILATATLFTAGMVVGGILGEAGDISHSSWHLMTGSAIVHAAAATNLLEERMREGVG